MESFPEIDLNSDFSELNQWLIDHNKELYERLSFYHELYNQLKVALFIHDLNKLRHVWMNRNYEKILGYTCEEIQKMGPEWAMDNYHPDDRYIIRDRIDHCMRGEDGSYCSIYRVRHKKGHWVWLYSNVTVFNRDGNNKPRYLLGMAIDFTESLRTMTQVEELVRENKRLKNELVVKCLSEREREVLGLIAQGKRSKEIAESLHISPHTVNNHRKKIMKKTEMSNSAELMVFALENGLV